MPQRGKLLAWIEAQNDDEFQAAFVGGADDEVTRSRNHGLTRALFAAWQELAAARRERDALLRETALHLVPPTERQRRLDT